MQNDNRNATTNGRWALAAALAAALWPVAAQAESLLDQGLNDAPAPATQPAPPAAAKPAAPAASDPNAAQTADDEELTKKLAGGPKQAQDDPATMFYEHLDASVEKLSKVDTSAQTQETQKRVIDNLDQLIEIARQQQNQPPPKPKPGDKKKPGEGQSRQQSQGKTSVPGKKPGKMPGKQGNKGDNAATGDDLQGGSPDDPGASGTKIEGTDVEWGKLPARDRDLILNASKEDALPAYKDMAQRYYQALADLAKEGKK